MASTNETAAAVRSGQADILALWAEVRRYAMKQANRWRRAFDGRGGVMPDDLEQAAFLALLDATGRWNESRGPFLSMYNMRLKSAFAKLYGMRTEQDRKDPLNNAASLDEPLGDGADDDLTLADVIPDAAAATAFDTIAEREQLDGLRQALTAALSTLPEKQRAAIVAEFWHSQRVDAKTRNAALKRLRHPSVSKGLKVYLV